MNEISTRKRTQFLAHFISALLLVFVATVPSARAAELTGSAQMDAVLGMKTDDEVHAYLRTLGNDQLLDLCSAFSSHMEKGRIPAFEGPSLVDVILLTILGKQGRDVLTSDRLLSIVADKSAPAHWRSRAIDYGSDPRCVAVTNVNVDQWVTCLTGIMSDPKEPEDLRIDAFRECVGLLRHGYYWILSVREGHAPGLDMDLRSRVRTENLVEWVHHDEAVARFVRAAIQLTKSDSATETLRLAVPSGLKRIVRERGLKTPALEEIEAFAMQNASKTGTLTRSCAELRSYLQEIGGAEALPNTRDR